MDAADARTVEIQPEELRELQPVRHLPRADKTWTIEAGDTIEHTYAWTLADRAEWALSWFGPATGLIAVLMLLYCVISKS
jgi:hypothetical protein